ncbi:MAG TPA: serine/threonine-protein kinase, partial [Polyangiaceae bacterium]|nr:serine/threonine-protein kinase [Polyangiaceae bacterium]
MENPAPERIVAGRYVLYGPIATGGMATVCFGRLIGPVGFARTVAIKKLRHEHLETPEVVSTLIDEARLASRIRHPNVVATLDMLAEDDEVLLVMEYVPGESLARLLATLRDKSQRMDVPVAAGIITGVLDGLHAAHEARDEQGEPLGIVHRDVTPENILVGSDGLARLLDFGIAKGKGRLQTTRAGQLKGKVSYMAPEQVNGTEVDLRADVFSAGALL